MSKKSKHNPNNELWLISYADLMTLLFGFFFLLYVMQEEGLKNISQSMKTQLASDDKKQRTPDSVMSVSADYIESLESQNKALKAQNKALKESSDTAKNSSASSGEVMKARLFLNPCRLCLNWDRTQYLFPIKENDELYNTVYVANITQGGPADVSGLKELDIITHVNDRPANLHNIRDLLETLPPNSVLKFKILREGKSLPISVTLDRFSDPRMELDLKESPIEEIFPGVQGRRINDEIRVKKYIPRDVQGWLIESGSGQLSRGAVLISYKRTDNGVILVKLYHDRSFYWVEYR